MGFREKKAKPSMQKAIERKIEVEAEERVEKRKI
ncbi:hypothetical protein COLO4_12996 [Corchorus olitorius]|uniref:Uncharacterized protein n=1 Tax=Corchorus olitorius TaxID=93759 RepID=A0A1R3JYT6_9ROSI|nr:hypothetical protein COLO4_12996 [Corchorus olitorius]